ncbi:MAG TPA: hypothetical protein VIF62_23440 [Labilithrix sp.]
MGRWWWGLGLGVVVACGSSSSSTSSAQGPFVARFAAGSGGAPAFLDVPFPSDVYLSAEKSELPATFVTVPGLDRVFRQNADVLAPQLARTPGWSRIAPALFALDDPTKPPNGDTNEPAGAAIDRTTLPTDENACIADASAVFLVDLESGKKVPCRAMIDDEREADSGRTVIGVGPARGIVLAEGHHYAAGLTSRLKDDAGHSLAATDDFVHATKDKQGPLAQIYGDAFDKVTAALGATLGADTIVALAPYTTQNVTNELYALRDGIESAAAPTLAWDAASTAPMAAAKFASLPGGVGTLPAGFTATLDEWLGQFPATAKRASDGSDDADELIGVRPHDKIDAVGTAVFQATNWLQVRPNGYDDLDHATFARDGAGKIVPAPEKPTNKIWVTIATPSSPMPATGYPAVIIQHGLSAERSYMLSLANRFCAKGWIAVAIDSVTFGARAPEAKYQVDATTDYAGRNGATFSGPDGLADAIDGQHNGSFDFFGNLKNLLAMRDQLRQSELDTAQLVKVLRSNPDLSPLATGSGTPKIDPDKIAYIGDSLGAIEGAVAAAIEPRLRAWTLNVGGGGVLVEIGAHGPAVNANVAIAGSINFGLRGAVFAEAHPLVAIGQALLEAGDPIAYADKLVLSPAPLAGAPTNPRNIFQIEVLYDELVANEGDEALARAGGWSMTTPNVGLNSGAAKLDGTPYPGGGIVLPFLTDDGTGFHDTPKPGITAVIAQASPAHHGADLVRSKGNRQYLVPFNDELGGLSAQRVQPGFDVPCPYDALQDAMVRFFGDAFDGKVPVITGLPVPKRDVDGDGKPDDQDPAPLDPSM